MGKAIAGNKVKVVFVIPNLGKGGAERVLSVLLENLDRSKFKLACIFFDSQHVYKIPDDVIVYCLNLPGTEKLFRKVIYSINRIIKMRRIFSKENPDMIFSFFNTVNLAVISTRLLLNNSKKKMRLIISERTTPSIRLKEKMKGCHRNLTKILIKLLYPKADKIVAVSDGVKNDLITNFNMPGRKIDVIYNPVEIDKIHMLSQEAVTEHQWFNDDMPLVINVGSLSEQKAQEYLLKAFKRVNEKVDCRLAILGEGEKENRLKQLSEYLGINNSVVFLGFQKNPFKFVRRSSVFVLSSRREGFPNVLLEAMACGVPVISTRCQFGPEEIITDLQDGLLVPVEDDEKMADAILRILIEKGLSESITSKAKENVSRFDVKTAILHYERLFISQAV